MLSASPNSIGLVHISLLHSLTCLNARQVRQPMLEVSDPDLNLSASIVILLFLAMNQIIYQIY